MSDEEARPRPAEQPEDAALPAGACSPGDGGLLPAWEVAALPAPAPFTIKSAVRAIGPGVILLGAAIGSGEWLLGPALTAKYGGSLLWIATISVLLQVCLNTEAARYALYTGEPIFTGYMRTMPGSRFWTFLYLGGDSLTLWPGLVTNAATGVAAAYLTFGRDPTLVGLEVLDSLKNQQDLIRNISYLIFASCVSIVLFGGKVYNTLRKTIPFMVIWILVYLFYVAIFMVGPGTWATVARGFVSFGQIPKGIDWSLVAAFSAFAGSGGLGNAGTSNYIREQGWGMGGVVGAIPSIVGGKDITLSHLGKIFVLNPENVRRFREWYKYVRFDQYFIWACGCFLGIALPAMLAVRFVGPGRDLSGWDGAAFQAAGIAREGGGIFWYLTLICGFWVLYSSQLLVVDAVGRRWSDMIWTGTLQPDSGDRNRLALLALGIASLLFGTAIATGKLSGEAMLWVGAIIYLVPAAIYGLNRLSRDLTAQENVNRVLPGMVTVYGVAVGAAILLARFGVASWAQAGLVLAVGLIWLVGGLFIVARDMEPHSVYKIYYLFVGTYVVWSCIAIQLAQPLTMIIIAANIGGFLLVLTSLHTWWVNRRFLPREIQAGPAKQATLFLCAGWYILMTLLSLDGQLQEKQIGNLGIVDLVARLSGH